MALPKAIVHTCKSWSSSTYFIFYNFDSNFIISKFSGAESINTLIIPLTTPIENVTAIILNNIERSGSNIIHVGYKYIISEAITTPID